MTLALIVHGGAGAVAPERRPLAQAGCARAASAGWQVLRAGGSAIDAVIAAITLLENDPTFNAGTGAVLTSDGVAELDAGIMHGGTLEVGAVAGLRRIKNPIHLARALLPKHQVMLIGAGAEAFAEEAGIPFCDPEELITPLQRARWQAQLGDNELSPESQRLAKLFPEGKHGTVGAVAIDDEGHIVAGASTGGVANKPPGRVGDTPIVGAGFYAENGLGGVSCTGSGEAFMRLVIARRVVESLAQGVDAQAAAETHVTMLGERLGGEGGLIVIDHAGRVGFARNTAAMSYAYCVGEMDVPISGV